MSRTTIKPDWAREVLSLRRSLRLSQADFAKKLNVSAMAVSRWERGHTEPTPGAYICLGNVADDPVSWFFWGRAGLTTADIMRVLPAAQHRLSQARIAALQIVNAGAGKELPSKVDAFVAIPVLPVDASTLGEHTEEAEDLDQLKPKSIWAAPASWCPNPARTISLRVRGNSMSPLILDGYLIAVDTSEISRDKIC
jgi:transcriptional regulator with XRE-family HTH domain